MARCDPLDRTRARDPVSISVLRGFRERDLAEGGTK